MAAGTPPPEHAWSLPTPKGIGAGVEWTIDEQAVMIVGTHNHALVVLSILLAIAASYTALDLASRVRVSRGWARLAWLATAALAMGGGIWAMHFVAMLAFRMPGMPVDYDVVLTLVSLVVAILATGTSFGVMSLAPRKRSLLPAAGLFMGLGIVAMHYLGMAAMTMPAELHYDRFWIIVSVLIAIGAATAALVLATRNSRVSERMAAALVMGAAVSGMHYAGIQAVTFTARPGMAMTHGSAGLNQVTLAIAVAAATFLILFLALVAAMFDRRFFLLAEREAMALRQSEERFRSLYKRTPLPLYSLDRFGRIEHVSDACLDLIGYRREEMAGRRLTEFMTEPSARQAVQQDWPVLLRQGKLQDAAYQIVTRTGTVLDVVCAARVERDDSGAFVRTLGGLTDVTEARRAEATLRQAQKIEAIGQLTGGVAHDFNNLLAIVIGNLDLLRKRLPDDPKAARLVDSALQGAQRGAALTQRLLAFARRQDLKPEAVDVPALVRGMADLLQRSLGPMVSVDTHFPPDLPLAHVDANQLELALLNLAVNARDAMPNGGRLSIRASERVVTTDAEGLAAGRYLCLALADTGHGMDEQTLARAIDPFFTTKDVGKGTGMGLPMVQGLAAQSGGRLVLRSEPGRGTTAELWLPARPQAVANDRAEPATDVPSARPAQALTILAVDDDALVLMNTAAMLEDLGHTVLERSSALEALALLRSGQSVDLLITDQAMPGMTGIQLARILRTEQPDLPVLIASGYMPLSQQDAEFPRLNKPFDQAMLARALAALIRPHHGAEVIPLRVRKA
jgi:PAS domain S-box-containing protein